jgi:hypothetical protein
MLLLQDVTLEVKPPMQLKFPTLNHHNAQQIVMFQPNQEDPLETTRTGNSVLLLEIHTISSLEATPTFTSKDWEPSLWLLILMIPSKFIKELHNVETE